MIAKESLTQYKIPRHVAIIMDGNGRWAKQRGEIRTQGHEQGAMTVRGITEAAVELGIEYLTLYTFSTENWNRPEEEIKALMGILVMSIERETPTLLENNIRLNAIGDLTRLYPESKAKLEACIKQTACNTGLTLTLALSYSSRWEILEAVKQIADALKSDEISEDQLNEELFSTYLTTKGIPDPDLLIRTGGEQRISNFLMWQLSYSELYFTEVFWPDFTREHLFEAIADFQNRERRFGKISEQLK